jgi:hypothetical protein
MWVNYNYGRLQNRILLLKIPKCTWKSFFKIYGQFVHVLSRKFASPGQVLSRNYLVVGSNRRFVSSSKHPNPTHVLPTPSLMRTIREEVRKWSWPHSPSRYEFRNEWIYTFFSPYFFMLRTGQLYFTWISRPTFTTWTCFPKVKHFAKLYISWFF